MKIPADGTELHCEVTFHISLAHGVDDIALQVKAAEIDEGNGVGPEDYPTGYTFAQAFQIIWHEDPEWVRKNLLCGWTLDKSDESGTMQLLWPERTKA